MKPRNDDTNRALAALQTSCRSCGVLHRPVEPLAFDPVCPACSPRPR